MSTDLKTAPQAPVTALVSGIVGDAQDLLKQQLQLFKHELKAELRITVEAVLAFAACACLGFVGLLLIAFMAAYLLQWAAPGLPLWACFGIVGLVLLVVSSTLGYAGKLKLDSFRATSNEALHALKENVQWITNPK
jgi:Putative Actinobacterial Holin-X, holin superfamily III